MLYKIKVGNIESNKTKTCAGVLQRDTTFDGSLIYRSHSVFEFSYREILI